MRQYYGRMETRLDHDWSQDEVYQRYVAREWKLVAAPLQQRIDSGERGPGSYSDV